MTIGVIDTGHSNHASVLSALVHCEIAAERVTTPDQAEGVDALILPGVGAAEPVMAGLTKRGFVSRLRQWDRPLLGICLGMQLLFERSAEVSGGAAADRDVECLGLLPGRVRRLPQAAGARRVHMGWSACAVAAPDALGLNAGDYLYFADSFYAQTPLAPFAWTTHGDTRVPVMVRREMIVGVQAHPERSGSVGLKMLRGFAALVDGPAAQKSQPEHISPQERCAT